jgi:hypothetical protein
VASGATATIPWDAADIFDTAAMHDPSSSNTRLIAVYAGCYRIWGQIAFDQGAPGVALTGRHYLSLLKNGVALNIYTVMPPVGTAGSTTIVPISAEVELAAADYIEIVAGNDNAAGTGVNVTSLSKAGMILDSQ